MLSMCFYAHGTTRRSNPPSKAPRERPVATLLSTSLRLLPPLLLHPDRCLARIVAYGVATPVGATPSGSAGIPFHSVQPFNDALDHPSIRPSVRPSASLSTIYILCHPSHPPWQMRTLVVSESTILTFRGCSSSRFLSPVPSFSKLSTFICSFHFPGTVLLVSLFTRSYIHKHIHAHKARPFFFKYSARCEREEEFRKFLLSSFIRCLAWL